MRASRRGTVRAAEPAVRPLHADPAPRRGGAAPVAPAAPAAKVVTPVDDLVTSPRGRGLRVHIQTEKGIYQQYVSSPFFADSADSCVHQDSPRGETNKWSSPGNVGVEMCRYECR